MVSRFESFAIALVLTNRTVPILATKRAWTAEQEALISELGTGANHRGNFSLFPMDPELDRNANPDEGQVKNSVSRERLTYEMSELGKPVIRRATRLFEAVRDGIVDLVNERLLEKDNVKDIDRLDHSGLALLHQAARYNRSGVAGTLIDHGARIDVRTREEGLTPLHIAARLVWRA